MLLKLKVNINASSKKEIGLYLNAIIIFISKLISENYKLFSNVIFIFQKYV